MIRRVSGVLIVTCLFCAISNSARADDDSGIPSSYKTDKDPTSHQSEISDWIAGQVTKLHDDTNPDGQTAARQALIDGSVNKADLALTSPGYKLIYTDELNKVFVNQLTQAAPGNASVRTRVNISLITGAVIETSKTSNLYPTVMLLLKDPSSGVVYPTISAAASLLEIELREMVAGKANAKAQTGALLDGIGDAVIANNKPPLGGNIVEDSYKAISPIIRERLSMNTGTLQALIEANLKLQKRRLELYKVGVPEFPDADTYASLFLLDKGYWTNLTDAQQLQAMQQASDLISLAGKWASQKASNENRELILVLQHEGGTIRNLADSDALGHNQEIQKAAAKVEDLSSTSSPQTILDTCGNLLPALQNNFASFGKLIRAKFHAKRSSAK